MILNFIITNIGVILNLLGTIFIALAFGPYPNKRSAPHTFDGKGGKKYIAYFNYPILFYIGLLLIFIRFIFQLKF
jgi:hypothetical protein